MEDCSHNDGRVLELYGRDALNDHGERFLSTATNCKLAITNTILGTYARMEYRTRTKAPVSITVSGPSTYKPSKPIDQQQSTCCEAQCQPLAKADSDHNIAHRESRLSVVTFHPADECEGPQTAGIPIDMFFHVRWKAFSECSRESHRHDQPSYPAWKHL